MADPGCTSVGRRLVAVPPQPPDVAAERLGEQGEGDGEQHTAQPQRRNPGRRHHERDSLRCRHRLAPVASRQRRPQPRERPARREEQVARESDQQHPPAGRGSDLDAEHEDQERVDLSVELRAEGRLRLRAPCDPAVDEVEGERDGRQHDQRRGRYGQLEGRRGEGGDAHRERRARQRDPARPAETGRRIAPEGARERQVQGQAADEADEPAGAADPDRPRQYGEDEDRAGQPGQRRELLAQLGQRPPARRQRCSALEHSQDNTVPAMYRFDEALRRAQEAAFGPGEYVEQQSFVSASEIRTLAEQAAVGPGVSVLDLCCGIAGPGRFLTRELGCDYLGVDASASAVSLARERAGGLPCRFEVAKIPPLPSGTFDVILLLETLLAFRDKAALLDHVSRALPVGGRFAVTVEEGRPLTEAERAQMPAADTVWLIPLERAARPARARRSGRPLAAGLERVASLDGRLAGRCVRR